MQVEEVERSARGQRRLQLRREHVAHPLQALEHLRAVGAVAQDRPGALVQRGPGDLSGRLVAGDPDRHARVHDAGHRPDAAVVVVGGERDLAVLDKLQRLGRRPGDALEPEGGAERGAHRGAHPLRLDRRTGVGHAAGGVVRRRPPRRARRRPPAGAQRPAASPHPLLYAALRSWVATLNRAAAAVIGPAVTTGLDRRSEIARRRPHLRSGGGPLRPCVRARLVWRRLSCSARRAARARDDLARDRDARQSGASRRRGRGRRDRRRRGHPDPDPGRVPARRAGLRAARAGRVRGRGLHAAAGDRPADRGRDRDRAAGRQTVDSGPGLARRPGRRVASRAGRADEHAGHPPAADRLQRAGPARLRAPPVRHPPPRRARPRRRGRVPELLLAHDGPEGDARRAAAAALLQGPLRPAVRERAGDRPLALLDQHVPELGARAPVPLHRPQRRDQHAARQRQLDAGAGALAGRVLRGAAGDPARARATPPPSTPCSSCSCWRAARSRTR